MITVILPVFNDPIYIRKAVRSLLQQTIKDKITIKLLDNGSTDITKDRLLEISKKEKNVELIRIEKNRRSDFAAEVSLQTITPYIAFLFSDDTYQLNKLEKQLTFLEKNPTYDACFSNSQFFNEKGDVLTDVPITQFGGDISTMSQNDHIKHMLLKGNSLHPCGLLMKTSTYKDLKGFKGYLHRVGDMVFFTDLLLNKKVFFMKEVLQNITVWSNGRNESFNNTDMNAILGEKQVFYSLFTNPTALNKLETIFGLSDIPLIDEAEKLWFFGHQLIKGCGEVKAFGMGCIYKAIELDEPRFRQRCNAMGVPLGEYVRQ